ncbi:DUF1566 domain-containing protein [Microbulbifer sp. ARAS458-1]|uniref:Lcl domain-containing protein n=1 Tax=Microbulbifer sp. ARAS458-1 TaxID=3140242 RepID=UPI003877A601
MFIRNCLVLLLLVLTLTACDRGLNLDSRRYLPPPTSDSSPETPDDGEEDEDEDEDEQSEGGDQEENPGEDQKEEPVEEDTPPSQPANLIKLTASGAPLQIQTESWSDTGSEEEGSQWACIEDLESGLVWEVKRPGSGHAHSADSSYSWFDPESDTNSDANGQGQCYLDGALTSGADCNSRAFADRVRAEGLCGRSNWRVPSADELHTLVEQQAAGQYRHTGNGVFPSIEAKGGTPYWSADGADAQTAWALDFTSGEAVATPPSTALNLRLVSTDQAPQENTLQQYCEEFEHPELLPDVLCNGDTAWEISCDDASCSAVNYSVSVDLKFECAYRDSPELGPVMRCRAYQASSGEFLYEVCPAPYDCLIPPEDPQDPDPVDPEEPTAPGPAHLVKLGADGLPLAVQNLAWSDSGSETVGNQWSCVLDIESGLIWEVKRPTLAGIHHAGNRYSWHDPLSTTLNKANGLGQCQLAEGPTSGAPCNTQAFVERVRTANLCGLSNWRVPSIEELITLVAEESEASAYHIAASHFPGLNGGAGVPYWSANGGDRRYALAMDFSSGEAVLREPFEGLNLRLVSGNQSPIAIPQHFGVAPEHMALAPLLGRKKLDITLTGEDPDGDSLTFTLVSEPQHGDLQGDAPDLQYILDEDFIGEDSFTFTVSDGTKTSQTATVRIGVAPTVSPNPAAPTPISLSQLSPEAPLPLLLEDDTSDDDKVEGYLKVSVPGNTDILQDVRYLLAMQNTRSPQSSHYTFDVFTTADFSGSPLTQVTASDGAYFEAANHRDETLYVRIRANTDEAAPVYFELTGSSTSEQNRLAHYCEDYPHPELVPYNLCNWESGWEIGCDDERCIAVNSAPSVDLKYECDYRDGDYFENVMRCQAFQVSTGEFSHEICPSPHLCTRIKLSAPPDIDPGDTIPVTDPIEIEFNTPGIVVELPTTPAYGVDLSRQLFRDVVRSDASQQILGDFLETLRTSLIEDASEDSTVVPWRDYVLALVDSGAPVSDIMETFVEDAGNGNQEAGASLFAALNELLLSLTAKEQSELSNDEVWLLTIAMAHINDRRELLVTNAEDRVDAYFAEKSDCFGLHCVYVSKGFPQVLSDAIASTDADLIAAGALGGVAVAGGVGTYFTLTSSVVLSTAMVHTAATAAKAGVTVSAFISGSASVAALPAVLVTVGIVCTVVSVSNLIEAGENEAAYNAFIQDNNARFEDLSDFTGVEHSEEVRAEIINAAFRMLDGMYH